jgi:universal stress protein E
MKRFKNILVAADTRLQEHPLVDEAAAIARHNGATLKLVDVVPEFPWAVRLVMRDHQHVQDLLTEEKRQQLESLAQTARATGINVTTKVLHGASSVEIVREVLRDEHDLVIAPAKGANSRRHGFFGNTSHRLLRKCPCALWLVTPGTTPEFKHVLACVNTSASDDVEAQLNANIMQLSTSISQYAGGRYSVVHAWSIWNEPMLRSHLHAGEFDDLEKSTQDHVAQSFDKFLNEHGTNVGAEHVHLIRGEPGDIIPAFARENNVDLVVMGTVARAGITGLVMGNTAETILNSITCSVLALKPSRFVCPIKLDD